jgi:hypothetical protein
MFSVLEETMRQRTDTAKRYSSITDQHLAERLFEIRKLREAVRKAESDKEEAQRGLRDNISRTTIQSEIKTVF